MISGADFVVEELAKIQRGVCPACHKELPPISRRVHEFTCNVFCHNFWINDIIARYGETRIITSIATGKRYLVPIRVILEKGIQGKDLVNYPEWS